MLASKLTEKFQATIPAEVRACLGLHKGDMVAFEVENDTVKLRRVTPLDVEYAKALAATLSEWSSENDDEAYRDL